jgi:calcineurin-like phosphoesterase family protein
MKTIQIPFGCKVGVTADTHVGHRSILAYSVRRPWLPDGAEERIVRGEAVEIPDASLVAHDASMAWLANETVGWDSGGILIHAGDVAWSPQALRHYCEALAMDVYVVVGNHDNEDDLVRVFGTDRVFERLRLEVENADKSVTTAIIDHYPNDVWRDSHKGAIHLFGHVHGGENERRRKFPRWALSGDCGVDSHQYRPWLWHEEILPHFAARRERFEQWRTLRYAGKIGGLAPRGEP